MGTILVLSLAAGTIILTLIFLSAISGSDFHWMSGREAEPTPTQVTPPPEWDNAPTVSPEESRREATESEPVRARDPVRITLSFAGDITVPKLMQDTMMINDHEYNFMPAFEGVTGVFSDADLSVATLETLITDRNPYGMYNAPSALLETLREAGIHHLNLATEHMLDLGFEGLDITKSEVNRLGLEYSGYLASRDTDGITSVNGVRIAVLSYTYGLSDEGRVRTGKSEPADIPIFSVQKVLDDIRTARAQGADLVIVLPHWGMKNVATVTDGMRETARQMAECGADLIIGAHSNVVSEAKFIETTRADGRTYETLVCYSLGALLMDARNAENAAGIILSVELEYDPETRQSRIVRCHPVPLYIYQDRINDRRTWRILNVENAEQLGNVSETVQAGAAEALERVRAVTEEIER